MARLPPLLVFLYFLAAVAAQKQPIPTGGYVYTSADYARVAIKSIYRPLGQLWLYNASLVTTDGYTISHGTLTVVNAAEGAPSVNDTITFTASMSCSESNDGLQLAITSCSDPEDLCESGFFQSITGASSYDFGVTSYASKAAIVLAKLFTVEVPIVLTCAPGYTCGTPAVSQCSSGVTNGTLTSITFGGGLCSTPDPVTSAGSASICPIGGGFAAGNCTYCNVAFNSKGQAVAYSSGTPPSTGITFAQALNVNLATWGNTYNPGDPSNPLNNAYLGGNYTADFYFTKVVAPSGGYSLITCNVQNWRLPAGPANTSGASYFITTQVPFIPVPYRPSYSLMLFNYMGIGAPVLGGGGTIRLMSWAFDNSGNLIIDRSPTDASPNYYAPGGINHDQWVYPAAFPQACDAFPGPPGGPPFPCVPKLYPYQTSIGAFQWIHLEP